MDDIDYANQIAEDDRQRLLREALSKAKNEQPAMVDGIRICLDCDEPIAADRLAANPQAVRCMDCQRDIEKKTRRRKT